MAEQRELRAQTRREQRRRAIIAAAEAELAESGLAGITLSAVGERVGLSKGALYYYVDGRDSLLALMLGDALDEIRAEAALLAGPDAEPLDRLRAFGRAHVSVSTTRAAGPLIASSVYELASHDATAELLRAHTGHVTEIIQEAVVAGALRPAPPIVATAAFFGTLNTLARTHDSTGEFDLDDVIDAALDLLLGGWATRTEEDG